MKPHEILSLIWSHSAGRYVFLPSKTDHGGWIEGTPLDPEDHLGGPIAEPRAWDLYFTPLKYDGPLTTVRRQSSMVGDPGVIFADLDGHGLVTPIPPKSIVVRTSPHHYHAYWLLDQPYPVEDWAPRAKGTTQALGADPGGWDSTQVLRIPGTLNHKFTPPERVEAVSVFPDRVYSLDDFPMALVIPRVGGGHPVPSENLRLILLGEFWEHTLGLSLKYWLTMTTEEMRRVGQIDRSKVLWRLINELLDIGLHPDDVFQLLAPLPINKFGADYARLYADILKARSQR